MDTFLKTGRKIADSDDEYISVIIQSVCDATIEKWHQLGFTPNAVTLLSCLIMLIGFIGWWNGKVLIMVVCLWIYCYMDFLDGMMARKYNQCTYFGDILDHTRDVIIHILITVFLYIKTGSWIPVIMYCVFMIIHEGYIITQDRNYHLNKPDPAESPTLKIIDWIPISADMMPFFKWFGPGFLYMVATILIFDTKV